MARRVANLLALAAAAAAAAAKCEVLRSLEFQQHTAPKGVSELLGPVMSLVSEKADEFGRRHQDKVGRRARPPSCRYAQDNCGVNADGGGRRELHVL